MAEAKILIRGKSGGGKTSLVNQALLECGIQPRGLRALRYFNQGQEEGFNLLALSNGKQVPLVRGQPFARKRPQGGFFEEVALPMLREELSQPGLLLVDEIGRYEKQAVGYLDTLVSAWQDPQRPALYVLKKENLPFNDMLWDSADNALRIDCDEVTAAEAGPQICAALTGEAPKHRFVRIILESAMNRASALQLMDRLKGWLNQNPGKGLGIVCSQEAELLHTAAGMGLIPVMGDKDKAMELPFFRHYDVLGTLVLTRRFLTLPDWEWEALLKKTAEEAETNKGFK